MLFCAAVSLITRASLSRCCPRGTTQTLLIAASVAGLILFACSVPFCSLPACFEGWKLFGHVAPPVLSASITIYTHCEHKHPAVLTLNHWRRENSLSRTLPLQESVATSISPPSESMCPGSGSVWQRSQPWPAQRAQHLL